ncbi:MAG TPA: helix-turn-helix transcriptional regulator [Propionibacteriaceae bacterium]|nr:helix-turn-helix transcriptional regulator [Propionibacteriaceae bacterium]
MTARQESFAEQRRRKGQEAAPTLRSINSLVAANVTHARTVRGMTQEQLGKRLEAVTDRRWSKATVSALERSADGVKVRQFDADDLVAIAHVLDVPLLFLFKPSLPEFHPNERYTPHPVNEQAAPTADDWTAVDLARVLFGAGDATASVGPDDAAEVVADTFAELLGTLDAEASGRLVMDMTARKLRRWHEVLEEIAEEVARAMAERSGRP